MALTVIILGVIITSNLNWQAQTDYMCKKAYSRIWILRRLKPLGANQEELIDVYIKQIRCILEFAVAAWNPGLTKGQIGQIERVQKSSLAVILDKEYKSYNQALKTTNLKTLQERRKELCRKFASKALKHEKFSTWFCPNKEIGMKTRTAKTLLKPVSARTIRYEKSPIAYLTRLLNEK